MSIFLACYSEIMGGIKGDDRSLIVSLQRLPVIVFGLAMLLCGGNLIYRGNLWNIVLGGERYFVGGLFIVIGLYFTWTAFEFKRKNKKS